MQRLIAILFLLLQGISATAQPFRVLYRNGESLIVDAVRTPENTFDVARADGSSLNYPSAVPTGGSAREIMAAWIRSDSVRTIETARSRNGGKSWVSDYFRADWDHETFRSLSLFRLRRNRLVLFSGGNPILISSSHTNGELWSNFYSANRFGGFRVSSVVPLPGGRLMALFHDDGRFLYSDEEANSAPLRKSVIYKLYSDDGGLTWSEPQIALKHNLHGLYDAVIFHSPGRRDKELILIAAQRETGTACISFSNDNGQSWSYPDELPPFIRGDRFGIATHKRRIFLSYRDLRRTLEDGSPNPTFGDIVLWEGTLNELLRENHAGVKVRIADNYPADAPADYEDLKYVDCGYVSVLPQGRNEITFVAYGRWEADALPFIRAFTLDPVEFRNFTHSLK